MKVNSYRDLNVWQKAMELADLIYDVTVSFSREETYGLKGQMRGSAVSIPSNIAEGSTRGSKKDFTQFVNIARGSLAELETQMLIAAKRKYIQEPEYPSLEKLCTDISKMIRGLLGALKQ